LINAPSSTSKSILNARNEAIVAEYSKLGYEFPDNPTAGSLVVGPDEVMNTPAGYYIGAYCFEWLSFDDGETYEWFLQPYDRYTMYMSKEEAEKLLALDAETETGAALAIIATKE
jgi:hypothetical protein